MARGENTANHPNRKVGRDDKRMQAREDSYGESGEYEAEAKYAAQQRSLGDNTVVASTTRPLPRVQQAIAKQLIADTTVTTWSPISPQTADHVADRVISAYREGRGIMNGAVLKAGGTGAFIDKAVNNRFTNKGVY